MGCIQQAIAKVLLLLFLLLNAEFGIVLTYEPVSTFAAVTGAAAVALSGIKILHCRFVECCDDRWITANITGKLLFTDASLLCGVSQRYGLQVQSTHITLFEIHQSVQ